MDMGQGDNECLLRNCKHIMPLHGSVIKIDDDKLVTIMFTLPCQYACEHLSGIISENFAVSKDVVFLFPVRGLLDRPTPDAERAGGFFHIAGVIAGSDGFA